MLPVPFVTGNMRYNAIFIVSYVCWISFEIVMGRSRKAKGAAKPQDRGSFFFLVAMIWLGISLDFAFCFGVQRAAIPWMRTEVFLLGIALMWIGIAFRYYCMRVLGKYFTFNVATQGGQIVVEAGPYRYVRHPSYTGAIMTLWGFGLTLGNWAGLLALIACGALGYAYRISVEEHALVMALGRPYREYMGRTQRLVPFVL
jgi:protein-S-isoprenylcysteine O-methyltransferase Ste14